MQTCRLAHLRRMRARAHGCAHTRARAHIHTQSTPEAEPEKLLAHARKRARGPGGSHVPGTVHITACLVYVAVPCGRLVQEPCCLGEKHPEIKVCRVRMRLLTIMSIYALSRCAGIVVATRWVSRTERTCIEPNGEQATCYVPMRCRLLRDGFQGAMASHLASPFGKPRHEGVDCYFKYQHFVALTRIRIARSVARPE